MHAISRGFGSELHASLRIDTLQVEPFLLRYICFVIKDVKMKQKEINRGSAPRVELPVGLGPIYGRPSVNYPSCLGGRDSYLSAILFYTTEICIDHFALTYSSSNPDSMMLLQRALRLGLVRRSMATGHGHGHSTESTGIKMVIYDQCTLNIALVRVSYLLWNWL